MAKTGLLLIYFGINLFLTEMLNKENDTYFMRLMVFFFGIPMFLYEIIKFEILDK